MKNYEVQLVENIVEIYRGGTLKVAYPFKDEQAAKQFVNDLVEITDFTRKVSYTYKVN